MTGASSGYYVRKIVNKGAYWSGHGRRKVPLHERMVTKEPPRDRTRWFSTVAEAFRDAKRRHA